MERGWMEEEEEEEEEEGDREGEEGRARRGYLVDLNHLVSFQ
jgi:hypothetical protein